MTIISVPQKKIFVLPSRAKFRPKWLLAIPKQISSE
jgi:hypothetical protein